MCKTIDEIKLNSEEISALENEILLKYSSEMAEGLMAKKVDKPYLISGVDNYQRKIPSEVLECYKFSKYVMDPNKARFKKVVRIFAFMLRFIKKLQKKSTICQPSVTQKTSYPGILSDEEICASKNYFFKKATSEVKEFVKENEYQKISFQEDGILYYKGRILATEKINASCEISTVMKDLCSNTFCVPVIYKHYWFTLFTCDSLLAYSIVNEIHWHSDTAKYSGVESVWRYALKVGYIMQGRDLFKKVKKNCERCRYLGKKAITIEMSSASTHNLGIASAFYATQVDLCGPFKVYSPHNKRTTTKIWLVVYCCMSASTALIKVMEDYSTTAFIQSFVRFSCEVGYPKFLSVDEGSQLVKGCESMKLTYTDIKRKLHKDSIVEFDACLVGGHNYNGKVERRIRQIKEFFERNTKNERLSVLHWEITSPVIANTTNDLLFLHCN